MVNEENILHNSVKWNNRKRGKLHKLIKFRREFKSKRYLEVRLIDNRLRYPGNQTDAFINFDSYRLHTVPHIRYTRAHLLYRHLNIESEVFVNDG